MGTFAQEKGRRRRRIKEDGYDGAISSEPRDLFKVAGFEMFAEELLKLRQKDLVKDLSLGKISTSMTAWII